MKSVEFWLELIYRLFTGQPAPDGSAIPITGLIPVYTSIVTGELAGSTTGAAMPDVPCRMVKFKARLNNAGGVYIGNSTVTLPDGTTDGTTGFELNAGDDSGWILTDNLNRFSRRSDNAGDDLTYMALR